MHYQVLARKYRPKTLDKLIGQDVLVRTLTNAIEQSRIPHAFLLTGIRGVGKTSTARIIAKCLNYRGADGNQPMTAQPKDDCDQCRAIEEGRHPDVLEMDAASRTGVNDIRDIIDSVQYAPTMARYKIFIIDEVHMLSKNAFNALLKTLEEPPPHCIFIFATTEVRKIPVTILSRCMRFDLPRVETAKLTQHLLDVARQEQATVEENAARLIAFAAEGSVRDALSLLDQAIGSAGGEPVTEARVRAMLGASDRGQLFDLLEHVTAARPKETLEQLHRLYYAGAEPATVLGDLLALTHLLTKISIGAVSREMQSVTQQEWERGERLAHALSIPFLARLWQMLMKGLTEAQSSGNPLAAAEMVLIRIAYASELPPPGDLVKRLSERNEPKETAAPSPAPQPQPRTSTQLMPAPVSFEALIQLCEQQKEHFTATYLKGIFLIKFDAANRHLEFRAAQDTPPDLANRLSQLLKSWTGEQWIIALTREGGGPSLRERQEQETQQAIEQAKQDPLVRKTLEIFPGAMILSVKQVEDDARERKNTPMKQEQRS